METSSSHVGGFSVPHGCVPLQAMVADSCHYYSGILFL
jgi:hypothetical protein